MARAEVRAEKRASQAATRRVREAETAARSRRACTCPCHHGAPLTHPGEPCLCKRIAKAGAPDA